MNGITTTPTTISANERTLITRQLLAQDVLRGLDRTKTKGQAISVIAQCLDRCGFELDLVPGDILLGAHNTRHLSFSRKDAGQSIENSSVVFVWEQLDRNGKVMEFISYLS